MKTSIEFIGREVKSKALRIIIAGLTLTLGIVIIPLILPMTVLLHFILRLCGLRGFYVRDDDGVYKWTYEGAFQRQ